MLQKCLLLQCESWTLVNGTGKRSRSLRQILQICFLLQCETWIRLNETGDIHAFESNASKMLTLTVSDMDTPNWDWEMIQTSEINASEFSSASPIGSRKPMTMYEGKSKFIFADRKLSSPLWSVGRWHELAISHGIKGAARPSCKVSLKTGARVGQRTLLRMDEHNVGTPERTDRPGVGFLFLLPFCLPDDWSSRGSDDQDDLGFKTHISSDLAMRDRNILIFIGRVLKASYWGIISSLFLNRKSFWRH